MQNLQKKILTPLRIDVNNSLISNTVDEYRRITYPISFPLSETESLSDTAAVFVADAETENYVVDERWWLLVWLTDWLGNGMMWWWHTYRQRRVERFFKVNQSITNQKDSSSDHSMTGMKIMMTFFTYINGKTKREVWMITTDAASGILIEITRTVMTLKRIDRAGSMEDL